MTISDLEQLQAYWNKVAEESRKPDGLIEIGGHIAPHGIWFESGLLGAGRLIDQREQWEMMR